MVEILDLNKYLKEVQANVNATPKNVASQTKLAKHSYSFSNRSLSEQLVIWDYIWHNATDDWTCMQSYLFLEANLKNKALLADSWNLIKNWQKRVNNWGDSDALSRLYTKILELIPDKVLGQLEQWNKSPNLWDRRQSLVSLLYFSRTKKVFLHFDTIIQFIDRLLIDEEYYVQKAVGWSLKESYNVYPRETLRYLYENSTRISATAFGAATEKLKKEDKKRLKNIRKISRKRQQ